MKKKNNAYDLGGILQGIAPLLGLIPGGQVAAPIASMAGGFISQASGVQTQIGRASCRERVSSPV